MNTLESTPTVTAEATAVPPTIHPESLLNLGPIRQMFEDSDVRKVPRAIDARWTYEGAIGATIGGFNQYEDAIYYGAKSFLARWMRNPYGSAREVNEGDLLIKEVLFAAHDYLHIWAVQTINALQPEHGYGWGKITPENFETHAFLHLITEAVATVGLDYWYLSTFDINDVAPIGTTRQMLTIDYMEKDLAEFQRFNADFAVQTPQFFVDLASFYATGVFYGFDITALKRSPKTLQWLRHELSYGGTQREYTRMWLRYLTTGQIQKPKQGDKRPVAITQTWQQRLLEDLGQALWRKIKDGDTSRPGRHGKSPWRSPVRSVPDLRFTNLNCLQPELLAGLKNEACGEINNLYHYYQFLSGFDYAAFDPKLLRALPTLAKKGDVELLRHLFDHCPRVEIDNEEPRDLLLLN